MARFRDLQKMYSDCTRQWRAPGLEMPTKNAPVAQLDRAPDYESGGQEFESLRARQIFRLSQLVTRLAQSALFWSITIGNQMATALGDLARLGPAIDWYRSRGRSAACRTGPRGGPKASDTVQFIVAERGEIYHKAATKHIRTRLHCFPSGTNEVIAFELLDESIVIIKR
jgi:hypothetical protein